jgi:hypothetical protein
MRVLTASQADNVALESNLLQQGLLTYALIHDGLEAYQADDQPRDHIITLSEWLKYGVKRVPALYEEVKTGQIQSFARGEGSRGVVVLYTDQDDNSLKKSPALQQPALFDFTKHARATVLVREAENLKRTESSPKKTASP